MVWWGQISRRKKKQVRVESIPEGKKRGKGEKRKTRIPLAGRAVLRACTMDIVHAHVHYGHYLAMNCAPMCFLSLVTLVWMI